jgi:hypothetical protein
MLTDARIPVVNVLFVSGEIHCFADVFTYVPPATLANACQIPRSRFRNMGLLVLPDLHACSKLLSISPHIIFEWAIQKGKPFNIKKCSLSDTDILHIDIIGDRIALGKLQRFSELFAIIPCTCVARLLTLHNDRIATMIYQPETINVRMIIRFAHLFQVTPAIVFQLILNEWLTNATMPITPIKPTIQLLPKKLTA